jgi:hypothetical protein
MNTWEGKKEKISSFEYRENPLGALKSITLWWKMDKSEFIVTDEFTGLAITCSTFDLGWQFFSNWVYERCHGPRWEN